MKQYRPYKPGFILALILVVCITAILAGSPAFAAEQEREPTTISIVLDPANPGQGDEFYITGTLLSSAGEPLGNKWVTLESTAAGATPGKFQYLKVTRTNLDGSFSFYRPATSPPEDLKVLFKGLYPYASSESEILSAKK